MKATDWIKIEERRPEDGQLCLIHTKIYGQCYIAKWNEHLSLFHVDPDLGYYMSALSHWTPIVLPSREDPENDGSRFALLHRAASFLVGPGIRTNLRNRELVIARMMIAYQMRLEGFSLKTIGRYLIRHHASVIFLLRKMADVLQYPKIYQMEVELWQQFQDIIKQYENQKLKNRA